MVSHRILAAICVAVASVGAQSIPDNAAAGAAEDDGLDGNFRIQFVLSVAAFTPSSDTTIASSDNVPTPSAATVSSDASSIAVSSTASTALTTSSTTGTLVSGEHTIGFHIFKHLLRPTKHNIHIVRYQHHIINHIDKYHTAEHHISKHNIFNHLIGCIIIEPPIVRHIIFKFLIIEHLLGISIIIIIQYLIFRKSIVKSLVVANGDVNKFHERHVIEHIKRDFLRSIEFHSKPQLSDPSSACLGASHYRLRFWYGLGINTATGSPGNCKLTLTAAGSYSTSNVIYVGGTPQGEYYLSDQTFTPSSDLRSSIRVEISCTTTATVDILLDNFSLIDPLECT
ncbi:hypothetical protein CSOJ01_02565 [Colletotrichum sojae]|uniref:Secreted protein n=1 Tax=Colletotrichum sojae TaxID=2175907 RepID=A0A8H6N2K5_9PEZI|nr:hypothetical protein CSOJ01_02565 [Colletotrichum sojae]